MSAAVAHRGPDDVGIWHDVRVVLAHRRLSIIDLTPLGHQPMVSSCGRYVIVLNGEIYNYLELRRELQNAGETFRSNSDTEVLLVAFRRWGPACLTKLNGMWAFAIWDRENQRLFASRDRFGKKPFYYAKAGDGLYFASEIKALLEIGNLSREANLRMVADFCAERVSDHTEDTFFQGINQLPAAHFLWWADGSTSVERYWRIQLKQKGQQQRADVEQIAWLLGDAVRLRLRADTAVGCLLSGGLDSSSVTCFAALNQPPSATVHAFSTVHEDPVPEAAGIDAVVSAYPAIACHVDRPTAEQFWQDLNLCLWHQEEPFADASMLAHFRLMRVVGTSGIKVLLTGQGADEVFGGYPGHLWHYLGTRLRLGELTELLKCYRGASAHSTVPLRTTVVYAIPHGLQWRLRRWRAKRDLEWVVPECRNASVQVHKGWQDQQDADPSDKVLLDAIEHRTLPAFLHYEDRNSMAFGVESRVPFLDYRLVEYAFSLPAKAKFAGGTTKALVRSAVADVVPVAIRQRLDKQGYPAPLSAWLRAWTPAQRSRCVNAVAACQFIRVQTWRQRLERFERGDDTQLAAVWRGIVTGLWHQRFVERRP